MANLTETQQFDPVYQLETTDVVVGGPGGKANQQAQELVNRTAYLKKHVDDLESGATPASKADKLTTARTLAVSGAATGSATFDGSGDATINVALAASPALTGTPTAPTAAAGTNTTQISTTAFVQAAIAALVASSPAALDTLNELAVALGNDPNFATTMTNALAAKAPLASPALTGTPTVPTAPAGTNTTQAASTAFVQAAFTGRKNYIINGNFDIWQRGISVTASGSVFLTDRWKTSAGSGGSPSANLSRQSFAVGDIATYFYRHQQTAAATANGAPLYQCIEGVSTLAGKTVTVSFWAKSDSSRVVSVNLFQSFGTGGSPSSAVVLATQDITATSAWQKFTLQFSIPSISGKTIGTNGDDYLACQFRFPANVASFTIDIAQVQLEEGGAASQFSLAGGTIGGELSLCQRYCYQINGSASGITAVGTSQAVSTVAIDGIVNLPVMMRGLPALTLSATADILYMNAAASGLPATATTLTSCTNNSIRLSGSVASGLVAGNSSNIYLSTGITKFIRFDAEL